VKESRKFELTRLKKKKI